MFNTPELFVSGLLDSAKEVGEKHNIPYLFILAQGALESNWSKAAIGNNIFGIKANSSWKGKKVLVVTTEYHDTNTVKYPEIISIQKTTTGKYKYTVKDYFRDYDSLAECLEDHCQFLIVNKRYAKAFQFTDPYKFAEQVALAGYATSPTYYKTLCAMIDSVKKRLPK
jgi:flagellar protein FlgJ